MRWLRRTLLTLAALLLLCGGLVWWLTRASLPQLDGSQAVSSIAASVVLERDAAGILTVTAVSDDDLAYGLGYAHGQDRFFQMDSARRLAAGELAALFGAAALPQDRRIRPFRWRALARERLAGMRPMDRRWLESYARGVDAGLQSLRSRPVEYWLLRARPEPWLPEDSLLVLLSMYWQLQSSELAAEQFRLDLQSALETPEGGDVAQQRAAAITSLMLPRAVDWDAPMFATQADAKAAADEVAALLPSPDQWDLRQLRLPKNALRIDRQDDAVPGSNNWGLAGRRTASGAALIANDMHLGLGVPPVWYRARLRLAGQQDLNGVTLPGLPALVAGSNGDIAWGFTNSYGDWLDLRRVSCDPQQESWQASEGPRPFQRHAESIAVRGGAAETLLVRMAGTELVYSIDIERGECVLLSWLVLQPQPEPLDLRSLTRARSVAEALLLAPGLAIPQQNLVVGDRDGNLAWTIAGRVPRGEHPSIVNPEAGAVWTANARAVTGEAERQIGGDEWQWGAGYDLGARARQIRDGLDALTGATTPADMLRLQLDDRAIYLDRWRGVLLGYLDEDAARNQPLRAQLRALIERWDGRAAPESVGYRLVRASQRRIEGAAWSMLLAGAGLDAAEYRKPARWDATAWRLVNEQPAHLLAADYADWRDFVLRQVDAALVELKDACPKLAECRWGDVNDSGVRHPLSRALTVLGYWFDMRNRAVAGDTDMPRVHAPGFGASERFAVSPGREAEGYLQLPGGQSGHPMSPFFRAGFEDWLEGRPTPFLPGPTRHKLNLSPRDSRKP